MRKIALVNQKGGVGKTTTAVNLCAAFAHFKRKTLLIDLDPQANATISFGLIPHKLQKTIYTLLAGKTTLTETIHKVGKYLHVIPSNIDLAGAELELSTAIGREYTLRDAMEPVTNYEFIIVDSPPSMGILNVNGLTFVDEVFIPLQCEFFAMHGISLLARTIDLVKKRLNPSLKLGGVIACMYDARKSLSREVEEEISSHFSDKLFKTRIRANVKLAESPSHGKTIFDYAPESNGAHDYLALAREILGIADEAPKEAVAPSPARQKESPPPPAQSASPIEPPTEKVPVTVEHLQEHV